MLRCRKLQNIRNKLNNSKQQQQTLNTQPPLFHPQVPWNQSPMTTPLQTLGRGGRAQAFCGRGGRGGRFGCGRGRPQRRDLYCWTHGAGQHGSHECNTPAPGHQYNATFENKMGGSLRYCPFAKAEAQWRNNAGVGYPATQHTTCSSSITKPNARIQSVRQPIPRISTMAIQWKHVTFTV